MKFPPRFFQKGTATNNPTSNPKVRQQQQQQQQQQEQETPSISGHGEFMCLNFQSGVRELDWIHEFMTNLGRFWSSVKNRVMFLPITDWSWQILPEKKLKQNRSWPKGGETNIRIYKK